MLYKFVRDPTLSFFHVTQGTANETGLRLARLLHRTAHASKAVPKWQQNNATAAGVSCCPMPRSRQLVVEVPAKESEQMQGPLALPKMLPRTVVPRASHDSLTVHRSFGSQELKLREDGSTRISFFSGTCTADRRVCDVQQLPVSRGIICCHFETALDARAGQDTKHTGLGRVPGAVLCPRFRGPR